MRECVRVLVRVCEYGCESWYIECSRVAAGMRVREWVFVFARDGVPGWAILDESVVECARHMQ